MNAKWLGKSTVVLVFGLLGGSLVPHLTLHAAARQASCQMTFAAAAAGSTGYVTSDGRGTYTNGLDGVSCTVSGGTNGNNNIAMVLGRKTTRTILGLFNNPVFATPQEGLVAGSYVTIQQIANMPWGTTIPTNTHYQFNNTTWTLNWCGGIYEGGCSSQGDLGSQAVSVTRSVDGQHWLVTTSGAAPAGDEADLYNHSTGSQIGLYHTPFQLTIDCLTTCQ